MLNTISSLQFPTPIPIKNVYLEALALCIYLMSLNSLEWRYIYEMPWRAALMLLQLAPVMLALHAAIGIVWLVLTQQRYFALAWIGLWIALVWMNRSRFSGIFKGRQDNTDH